MTRFYSILTTEADAGGGFLQFLPIIILAVCGVALVVSFIVGFKKGAKRVSWAGLIWLLTALAFFLLQGLTGGALKSAMQSSLTNMAAGFGVEGDALVQLTNGFTTFLPAFILALACILVVMIFYGIFSLKFRPKIKMIPKNADAYVMDEDGVEYDEDYVDYDDYESFTSKKMPMRLNCETPGFGTKLIGGFICFINTLMIVVTVLALALFLLNATSLKDGALSFLFTFDVGGVVIVPILVTFASRYALDFFFIGILIAFACKGRRSGFTESFRSLMKVVGLVLTLLCFYLPFSFLAAEGGNGFLYGLTSRCVNAMTKIFGDGDLSWLAPIVAKILAGLLLAAFTVALFVFLNWVLKKLAAWTEKHKFTKIVDGIMAFILYLAIGIAVCCLVWAIWYLLARYGIFNVNELFTEETTLSNGLFNTLGGIIESLLIKIDQALGILPA